MGDFNMPTIKWIPDLDLPGVYLPKGNPTDELFMNIFFEYDLKQIMEPPINRNHLDLAFVNDEKLAHCTYPIAEEILDKSSIRHAPFIVNFQVGDDIEDGFQYLNFGRTNLKKAKKDLLRFNFDLATEEDTFLEQWHENSLATSKIVRNIERIKKIVVKNTPIKKIKRNWMSKHPWLKSSKSYEKSHIFKQNARRNFIANPTESNKDIYKRACIFNSNVYEMERNQFLNNVMNDTKGNTMEFYSLMKSCTNTRKDTPERMLYKGKYVKGEEKLWAIASQLGSCFLQNPPSLGSNIEEINDSLLDIYNLNFNDAHSHLWQNFNLHITNELVAKMIGELKVNKDPGPMSIPAAFLQHNVEILSPIIQNAINTITLTGNIPEDWMKSYIAPIPKKGSTIDVENYRGIAMQSCLPKILDKFITKLLYEHLGETISPNQHGFRKGKSTTTNLIELTQLLHENAKKLQIDVIYLKAFDQIRHDLLAAKLSKLLQSNNEFYSWEEVHTQGRQRGI